MRCVLRHPHRTPWVLGLARGAWGRNIIPKPYSLGYWQNGSEAGRRTLSSHGPENPEEKEIAFFEKVGQSWRNRNKMKQKILLPALHRGKERRCSRRLLRKSKLQHLRVARIRAASSTSWTTWGLALLREARRAGLGVDSAWGGAALEDAGGRPRRRAD